MSEPRSHKNKPLRYRLPPAESQIAIAFLAALLGLSTILLGDFFFSTSLMLVVLFAAIVWAKRAWAFYLLFGTLIYLKHVAEPPHFILRYRGLDFGDVVTALTLMLFCAACFRYLQTAKILDALYPNIKPGRKQPAEVPREFPSLIGGRWWAIPLSVILACILIGLFPFTWRSPTPGITPIASRLIFLTLTLFFAWFVCRSLLSIFIRWNIKPDQADVYSRSLVAKEFWREAYDIEKRRVKQRTKETSDSPQDL